jgi:hypothetical protein
MEKKAILPMRNHIPRGPRNIASNMVILITPCPFLTSQGRRTSIRNVSPAFNLTPPKSRRPRRSATLRFPNRAGMKVSSTPFTTKKPVQSRTWLWEPPTPVHRLGEE